MTQGNLIKLVLYSNTGAVVLYGFKKASIAHPCQIEVQAWTMVIRKRDRRSQRGIEDLKEG
jgi:hypothetical protein